MSSSSTAPSERSLSIEAVLEVARTILWPDPGGGQSVEVDDGEAAEAAGLSRHAGKVGRLFLEVEPEAFARPRKRGAGYREEAE